jgi:integrase
MIRTKLPPHINGFIDRYGHARFYVRRPGHKNVSLPGLPWSPEFMAAYAEAVDGQQPIKIGEKRSPAGSVAATVGLYLGSTAFANLAAETQRTRRHILERFREEHGDKRIASIEKRHVQAMVTAKSATPSAARNFLIALRAVIAFAIEAGIRADDDPTLGIKRPKIKTEGYRTWTEDDIAAFEATHPIGTLPRLALALLLYTGQRRGDVVLMGRQHVRGDLISVRPQKTSTTTSATLLIPMHPALRAAIEATPSGHLTFLATEVGKPRAANGFSTWFRKCCNAAGLAIGTSAHGLRKAACRRLAEAGRSTKEITAISGHTSLREVERYTKAVDQEHMARAAMKRLGG